MRMAMVGLTKQERQMYVLKAQKEVEPRELARTKAEIGLLTQSDSEKVEELGDWQCHEEIVSR